MNTPGKSTIVIKIHIVETKMPRPRHQQNKKVGKFVITFREENVNGIIKWARTTERDTQISARICYSTSKTNNPMILLTTKHVKISVKPPTPNGDYDFPDIKIEPTRTHIAVSTKVTESGVYPDHYVENSKRLIRENYCLI